MDNYFQNIFPKIFGSQEDNQISNFGCPHSIFGRRGHANFATLRYHANSMAMYCELGGGDWGLNQMQTGVHIGSPLPFFL